MSDFMLMNIKEREKFMEKERQEQIAYIKKVIKYLVANNNNYWLEKLLKNKTVSGRYEVAQKVRII